MPHGRPPFDIDLIEVLYGDGEMSMEDAHRMARDPAAAWPVIAQMVEARTAAVWVVEDAGARPLADWEFARLLRSRLHHSGEPAPADDHLIVRPAERTNDAYHTDFARWYSREFHQRE